MYCKVSGFDPVCPQVIGMDTWNPITGKCGPGPSSSIVPKTGMGWEPIIATGPFMLPQEHEKLHEKMSEPGPVPNYAAGVEKSGGALLLLGIAAVAGFVLLAKR